MTEVDMGTLYEIAMGALGNSPIAIVLLIIYFHSQKANRQTVTDILKSHRQQVTEIVNGQHDDVKMLLKGQDKVETALKENTSGLSDLRVEISRHKP